MTGFFEFVNLSTSLYYYFFYLLINEMIYRIIIAFYEYYNKEIMNSHHYFLLSLKNVFFVNVLLSIHLPIFDQTMPSLPNTTLHVTATTFADYLMPSNFSSIYYKARAARGGSACNGICNYAQGRGALNSTRILIGRFICGKPNPHTFYLTPGGTLRFIYGKNGRNGVGSDNLYGIVTGDGGGGTAVLYKAPGSDQWQTLLAAGGDGGAFAKYDAFITNNCTGAHALNANLSENGLNAVGTHPGSAGQNGSGGETGSIIRGNGWSAGSINSAGTNGDRPCIGGRACGTEGGNGGSTTVNSIQKNGGFGFGGGAAGAIAIGGGYSVGGGGESRNGTGGGSGYSGRGGGSQNGFGAGEGDGSLVVV